MLAPHLISSVIFADPFMASNEPLWLGVPNSVLQFHSSNSSSPKDSTCFLHLSDKGVTPLLLYVDGIIINGVDLVRIEELKWSLSHHFDMKDLGTLSDFFWARDHLFCWQSLLSLLRKICLWSHLLCESHWL